MTTNNSSPLRLRYVQIGSTVTCMMINKYMPLVRNFLQVREMDIQTLEVSLSTETKHHGCFTPNTYNAVPVA